MWIAWGPQWVEEARTWLPRESMPPTPVYRLRLKKPVRYDPDDHSFGTHIHEAREILGATHIATVIPLASRRKETRH